VDRVFVSSALSTAAELFSGWGRYDQ